MVRKRQSAWTYVFLALVPGLLAVDAPGNLTATASGTTVALAWTAPVSAGPILAYVIEAGSSPGSANLANFSTGNTSTTFSATGVTAGSYYVRVRAMTATGVGPPSNEVLLVVGNRAPGCADFSERVAVHLTRTFAGGDLVSFGVPLPSCVNLTDTSGVRVLRAGASLDASVREILGVHDRSGARAGVRAIQIQFAASRMTGPEMDVDVVWRGAAGNPPGTAIVPYGDGRVSTASPETAETAFRSISSSNGVNTLVEGPHSIRVLFNAREPYVLATFPDGYLAKTGILGQQVSRSEAALPGFGGLTFLSDAIGAFGLSSMYVAGYALNPESVVDPVVNFEGWLYDRCATYLTAYAHTNDARFLREAHRTCWY